jgi:short-subunit dehydrogenase
MKTTTLNNMNIWITGASSGIGAALARQLNAMGARLILSARRADRMTVLRNSFDHPDRVTVIPLDITDGTSISRAVSQVEKGPRLDLLIHNAGIAQKGLAHENAMKVDREIMETNYFGTVALTKAVMPMFHRQGHGWFGIVSSFAGVLGVPGRSAYAASKHALHGFFKSLVAEHSNCKLDLSFIIPGFINTNITAKGLTANGNPYGKVEKSHCLGLSPEECAEGIIKGLNKRKRQIIVGKVEVLILYIHRISPALSQYIVKSHPMRKWRKFMKTLRSHTCFFGVQRRPGLRQAMTTEVPVLRNTALSYQKSA